MLRRTLALLTVAGGLIVASPAYAQHTGEGVTPADPESAVATAGNVILYYVAGRSLAEVDATSFNPFGIDGDHLMYNLGSFFITAEYTGEPVHEGEVSIYPQFVTPYSGFEASAATPGIIPFAFLKVGTCYAGYVTGFPVANEIYSVDLTPDVCHAENVVGVAYNSYVTTAQIEQPEEPVEEPEVTLGFDPAHPSDADLDVAVWAAYNAVLRQQAADPEYVFIRDGDFETVRAAIAAELETEGLPGIVVEQSASRAEAHGCAAPGGTVLRVAFTDSDLGITLVAASERRQSTYYYEPGMTDIDVRFARECRTSGAGRTHTTNVQ